MAENSVGCPDTEDIESEHSPMETGEGDGQEDSCNSGSESSSSPEGIMSDEEEDVNNEKILELENMISTSPYHYEPHVQLIALLRKAGELEKLRKAREAMSEIFPLTPELWLDWLTDEIKLAVSKEEKENIALLFERAVKDYASVSIWLEYAQFSIGNLLGLENGAEKVRQVFEQALTAAGLHVNQGALIWEAYREFERAILGTMQVSDTEKSAEEESKITQQHNRILTLFRRQLSVPLYDMEQTYEELQEWNGGNVDASMQSIYKNSLSKLRKLQPFEDSLISSEAPHFKEYKNYIEFEEKGGDPSRIQNIYERALVENCLQPELWQKYTKYLDRQLKIDYISLPVHEKAVRNCPWTVNLWVSYIQAAEKYHQPHEKIQEIMERALRAGFSQGEEFRQLWLTYLDYLRRRIDWQEVSEEQIDQLRNTFQRAVDHLKEYFGAEGDPSCIIPQYWAKIEAKFCKNISNAREIWREHIMHYHAAEAQMWLHFVTFEKTFGDTKHCRKILLRALYSASDWPESIVEALLTFEREEGNLDSLHSAVEKCEAQMKMVQERRAKIEEKEAKWKMQEAEKRKQAKTEKKFGKQAAPGREGKGRVIQFVRQGEYKEEVTMDAEGFKIPPPRIKEDYSRIQSPGKRGLEEDIKSDKETYKRAKVEDDETEGDHGTNVKHDPRKDDRTVFVSNLSFEVDENKIKEMFSEIGVITDLRLVRDFKGRSKGFCYVEFSTQEEAKVALKNDRMPIEGRPAYVSPCEDRRTNPSLQPKFKFKIGLEKSKLFIKGLPAATTQEELSDIFKEFGTLKEVRLVTYRNGHSKGLAYVEFEDEAAAKTALVKTDGMTIGSQVISVAISNPPQRKPKRDENRGSFQLQRFMLLGGGSSDIGPRGKKARSQISLIPRSVQRPQRSEPSSSNGSDNVQNGTKETEKKMSNSDFRKLFERK